MSAVVLPLVATSVAFAQGSDVDVETSDQIVHGDQTPTTILTHQQVGFQWSAVAYRVDPVTKTVLDHFPAEPAPMGGPTIPAEDVERTVVDHYKTVEVAGVDTDAVNCMKAQQDALRAELNPARIQFLKNERKVKNIVVLFSDARNAQLNLSPSDLEVGFNLNKETMLLKAFLTNEKGKSKCIGTSAADLDSLFKNLHQ